MSRVIEHIKRNSVHTCIFVDIGKDLADIIRNMGQNQSHYCAELNLVNPSRVTIYKDDVRKIPNNHDGDIDNILPAGSFRTVDSYNTFLDDQTNCRGHKKPPNDFKVDIFKGTYHMPPGSEAFSEI